MELKDDRSEKVKYDYIDYPVYSHRAYLSSFPDYAAPSHWHDDIEFVVVLSGKMLYNVNGEIVFLNEGEGIFVNAKQIHFGFSEDNRECDFICTLLHPMMLCVTYAYERDYVMPVLHNRDVGYIKLEDGNSWQKSIIESVKTIYSIKDNEDAPLKIQNLFSNIWIQIYENIEKENNVKRKSAEIITIKNMMGYIQKNYSEKMSLSDIAYSGSVGQSKCCKLFAKYIGQTPNEYLIKYRLDKSASLLSSTDMSVTEIANTVGFNSSSYYAETFRKWYKKSPSEYRKHQ